MLPASNAKLIVMSAAIDRLGPDFQFETILARRGDDLIVIGGGDPAFGDPKLAESHGQPLTAVFHHWAEALKAAGMTRIKGRLIYDDFIFDDQYVHPGWPGNQQLTWYEAPIGGLNLADNCVVVTAAPTSPGKPARLAMKPANTALKLINKTTTSKTNKPVATRKPGSNEIVISGPVSRECTVAELTIPDPGVYFAAALRTTLAAQGIAIDGEIVRQRISTPDGQLPKDTVIIARARTPLADVLARAGKNSLGMMAEGLIKRLGAAETGVGSWKSGTAAVERFVRGTGASPGQFSFDDGSGLSRDNRLSPATSTTVLKYMFNHRGRDLLMASLSHSGIDGTLDKRMKDIKDRVIAKTGFINGVRTLAGYIHTNDDRWLAFAFFYNNAGSTKPLSNAQDAACRLLVTGASSGHAQATSANLNSARPARRGKSR